MVILYHVCPPNSCAIILCGKKWRREALLLGVEFGSYSRDIGAEAVISVKNIYWLQKLLGSSGIIIGKIDSSYYNLVAAFRLRNNQPLALRQLLPGLLGSLYFIC